MWIHPSTGNPHAADAIHRLAVAKIERALANPELRLLASMQTAVAQTCADGGYRVSRPVLKFHSYVRTVSIQRVVVMQRGQERLPETLPLVNRSLHAAPSVPSVCHFTCRSISFAKCLADLGIFTEIEHFAPMCSKIATLLSHEVSLLLLSRRPASANWLRHCGSLRSVVVCRFNLATNDSFPLPSQARLDLYSLP